MYFKIDENLPVEIAQLLITAGYNAKTVNEQRLKGVNDPVLINVCKNENRILVTLDMDFSDIKTYPPQNFAGIIVLKLRNQAKSYILKLFQKIIPIFNSEQIQQHLWIVEETKIRIHEGDSNT